MHDNPEWSESVQRVSEAAFDSCVNSTAKVYLLEVVGEVRQVLWLSKSTVARSNGGQKWHCFWDV